jgi:hypothetical protein
MRVRMSGEVLESLHLIHTRLKKLEDQRQSTELQRGDVFAMPRWLQQCHGWSIMQNELDLHRQTLGGDYRITKPLLEKAIKIYNKYWYDITGVGFGFKFGVDHYKFVTPAEFGLKRNLLMKRMIGVDKPSIIEPFAGSGLDTVTMLKNLDPSMMYCCDSVGMEEGKKGFAYASQLSLGSIGRLEGREDGSTRMGGRGISDRNPFDYLPQNVKKMQDAVPETKQTQVVLFNMTAKQFFHEAKGQTFKNTSGQTVQFHADVLYLDPPWTLPGNSRESTADELVHYLGDEVILPMLKENFRPKLICVKTRFDWEEMRRVMGSVPGYLHEYTIEGTPFRSKINFHFLLSTDYDVLEWEPSKEYNHATWDKEAPEEAIGSEERAGGFGNFKFKQRGEQGGHPI